MAEIMAARLLSLGAMQSLFHLGQPFATTLTGRAGDQLVPMPHFGLALALPD